MARRAGLYDQLEKSVRRAFYDGEEDATERARALSQAKNLRKGGFVVVRDDESAEDESSFADLPEADENDQRLDRVF